MGTSCSRSVDAADDAEAVSPARLPPEDMYRGDDDALPGEELIPTTPPGQNEQRPSPPPPSSPTQPQRLSDDIAVTPENDDAPRQAQPGEESNLSLALVQFSFAEEARDALSTGRRDHVQGWLDDQLAVRVRKSSRTSVSLSSENAYGVLSVSSVYAHSAEAASSGGGHGVAGISSRLRQAADLIASESPSALEGLQPSLPERRDVTDVLIRRLSDRARPGAGQ